MQCEWLKHVHEAPQSRVWTGGRTDELAGNCWVNHSPCNGTDKNKLDWDVQGTKERTEYLPVVFCWSVKSDLAGSEWMTEKDRLRHPVCSDERRTNPRFHGEAHYANVISFIPYMFKTLLFRRRTKWTSQYHHYETLANSFYRGPAGKVYELYFEGKLVKTLRQEVNHSSVCWDPEGQHVRANCCLGLQSVSQLPFNSSAKGVGRNTQIMTKKEHCWCLGVCFKASFFCSGWLFRKKNKRIAKKTEMTSSLFQDINATFIKYKF